MKLVKILLVAILVTILVFFVFSISKFSTNKISDPLSDDANKKNEILKLLKENNFQIENSRFLPENQLKIELKDKTVIIFSLLKDVNSQVASLQYILRNARINKLNKFVPTGIGINKSPKLIDLTGEEYYVSF